MLEHSAQDAVPLRTGAEASLGSATPCARLECSGRVHILTLAKYPLGGIRTYLKYTYRHLDPHKYKFNILVTRRENESCLIPTDLSGFDLEFHESDSASANRALLRLARQALRNSCVDIIHSQGLTSGILAIIANWRVRRPHVITHHDVFRKDQFKGLMGFLKCHLITRVLSHADLIICVSDDAARNFSEFLPSFPLKKVTIVRNGIDTLPFIEVSRVRRRMSGGIRGDSPFTFAFLGRFMPQKGFDILIDAVEELSQQSTPRSFRVLAVNAKDDYVREYRSTIVGRGLDKFFEFPGFRSSVREILIDLDCVVMPSRWEAGPLLPMEVLVAGCPLIASDCIGLREIVEDTPTRIVRRGDPHSLAQQMYVALCRAGELRRSFDEFAITAGERFDVRRTSGALDKLFCQMIRR